MESRSQEHQIEPAVVEETQVDEAQEEKESGFFGREPVMYLAIIQTGLALVAGFGLDLSAEQVAAIMAFSAAVLGFLARQQVTPFTPAAKG